MTEDQRYRRGLNTLTRVLKRPKVPSFPDTEDCTFDLAGTVVHIGIIMLFIRATRGHGGLYRDSNAIRTCHQRTWWSL